MSPDQAPTKPFTVLELPGRVTAVCGRLLADAGGQVVKVEHTADHDDRARRLYLDTGKQSIAIDLERETDRSLLQRLVGGFDIVLESFAPGTLAELGIDHQTISQAHPGVTYVSITPFGQSGPYSRYRANDLIAFGMGGLMFISGRPDRPPVVAPGEQAAVVGGVHGAIAALASHWGVVNGGRGTWIDVSITECLAAQENTISNYRGPTEYTRRTGSQHKTALPGRIFKCLDGYIHIFINQDRRVWERYLEWIGRPEELGDPSLAEINTRWKHADLVTAATDRFVSTMTRADLSQTAQDLHLPVVPVYTIAEMVDDPQAVSLDFVETVARPDGGSYQTLKSPIRPMPWARTPAPEAGADTASVLHQFLDDPRRFAELLEDPHRV